MDIKEKNNSLSDSGDARVSTGLEFEFSEESGFVFDSEADISPEPLGAKDEAKAQDNKTDKQGEEFSLPDSYSVNEKYNTQSFIDDPLRIRPTYLPRFTEVSETYRMADDKRPRPEKKVSPEKGRNDGSERVDPTSEADEDKDVRKVIVSPTVTKTEEPIDESIKVFKFNAPVDESEADGETIETDDIKDVPPCEQSTDDIVSEINEEREPEQSVETQPAERCIPDPVAKRDVSSFGAFGAMSATDEYEAPDDTSRDTKKKGKYKEYTSPAQKDAIKDSFLDTIMSVKVRLVAALFVFFAVLTVNILSLFDISVLDKIGMGQLVYGMAAFDLMFCACLFLLALPEVVRAFAQLAKSRVLPELVLPVSLVLEVLYVLSAVAAKDFMPEYMTFAILFSLQVLAAITASLYRSNAEFESFKIVSKNTTKNVFDKRYTRTLPSENIALDGAVDEYNSKIARMFKTAFVSGFFDRYRSVMENSVNVLIMLGASLGVALVSALISFFIADEGVRLLTAMEVLNTVFLVAVPSFSCLIHKLPLYHTIKEAANEDSTFIGEKSMYDGADVDVIAFYDTEIFGIEDVSIKKVHLYGKVYNTPKAMKQMYSLFSVIGGPLDHVFSSSLDRKCESATGIIIEDDGISGTMEGHRICAGTEEYMRRNNITIPEEDYKTKSSATDSTKVMYGAEDGEVYVKFFIRYSFSEEFTMLLPDLKEKNIIPLIYTRDPNITHSLVRVLTLGEDIIRVMKKYGPRAKEDKVYRRVNAGIVTLGDKTNAINMVLLSKKYVSFQSRMATAELITMAVGASLAAVLSLIFVNTLSYIPALALGIWQIAGCAALYVRSRMIFKTRKKNNGD